MLVVTESFFFGEENGRNRADSPPYFAQPPSATPMGRISLSLGAAWGGTECSGFQFGKGSLLN